MNLRIPVITGMGIYSCLGMGLDEVTRSLKEGRSGIVFSKERKELGFRSALTAALPPLDPAATGLKRKALKTMDEPALYAYMAAKEAIADAGLKPEDLASLRSGVVFGNDSTVKASARAVETLKEYKDTKYIGSGNIVQAMNSTVSMNLAALLGTNGADWTISAACASSSHALGQALMLIRAGYQDIVITGGAQEVNWESMASFDALQAFSARESEPQAASRPFDKERDGLVPSGGGAALIIEELEHAKKRGAPIYGVLVGYGFSAAIGENINQSNSEQIKNAITLAMQDAGLVTSQIDYINAHATSTPVGDAIECRAIAELFGERVPVSSTKAMTGHECWMAGASEAIYTTLMAMNDFIAPNINFKALDDNLPKINVVNTTEQKHINIALSNSFGFGGTNGVLVFDYSKSERRVHG